MTWKLNSLSGTALAGALGVWGAALPQPAPGAGVTIITHGYQANHTYPPWVSAMAEAIPTYLHSQFPDLNTNLPICRMTVSYNGSDYIFQVTTNGVSPLAAAGGEIIVELDWSQLSGDLLDSYASTYNVGWAVARELMRTNTVPGLGSHPLAELPIHLIGHSRGGSLMSQVSYVLGTNGVWVDHLTRLDPYPLNNDGDVNPAAYSDASAKQTYVNVLFADNDWQDLGAGWLLGDPDGEPSAGAYNRQLSDLSGGYSNAGNFSTYHSNVHLWYFGTIDLETPASDGSAEITAAERSSWWTAYEQEGARAGFHYSRIGGGDRTSMDRPLGLPSDPAIRDGYNQYWDLGAGANTNRTALPANSGTWPNLIAVNFAGTNTVAAGGLIYPTFYYQYAGTSNVSVQIYYDEDLNPYNTNSTLVYSNALPRTGSDQVNSYSNIGLATTNVPPGTYAVYAGISDGTHTRYLYASEPVVILPRRQGPLLAISQLNDTQFAINVTANPGQTVILQTSTNLQDWLPLATNALSGSDWAYTNDVPSNLTFQFYRALLNP